MRVILAGQRVSSGQLGSGLAYAVAAVRCCRLVTINRQVLSVVVRVAS
jgi:hypothetical protein